MKLTAIMWGSYSPILKRAAETTGVDLTIYPNRVLDDSPEKVEEALESMKMSDVVLLYHTSDMFWEQIDKEIKRIGKTIPVISLGYEPSFFAYSSVSPAIVTTCQAYLVNSGDENYRNMLRFIQKELFGEGVPALPPLDVPWEGIYHPDAPTVYTGIDSYLAWYSPRRKGTDPFIGIIFSRVTWASSNTAIEDALIRSLEEKGLNVIPVFTYAIRDASIGAKGMMYIISEYLTHGGVPRVDAIIKLVPFLLGTSRGDNYQEKTTAESGVRLLKQLNIPIFHPIISNYQSIGQWRDSTGLTLDTGWAVAMPEFEGVIEPVFLGASRSSADGEKPREPVPDRCDKIAARVKQWVMLAGKPVHERRVSFIFNNNPCANADANVGSASHLDSLESVARILTRMKEAGYAVDPPSNGRELIETIMGKKALSEFRWTTVEDIVAKGGALLQMDMETYLPHFTSLPPAAQKRVIATWGEPPGLGMVYQDRILITGLSFGNATVHVQPKRGCFGARCDGQVCKILHDPDCPPPHQYLATYQYIREIFKADVVVHVGTHGNLEFLPGKGLGLSEECFPDIVAGSVPYLYIYNSDNPPEGTLAKRRSYATLVDHMQTVMTGSGLYEGLEELENLLTQYETAKIDPARAHALQHLILDTLAENNLDKDMHMTHDLPLAEVVGRAHEVLSKIRNTQIDAGMHIFGELPQGEKRVDFISSIIRYDTSDRSPRRIMAQILGLDLTDLLANQQKYSDIHKASYGALLEQLDGILRQFIWSVLEDPALSYETLFLRTISQEQACELDGIRDRIADIDRRIDDSREIESLFNGFNAGYIPAGPSGLISRGHEDVLPTGRNFYSLDPHRVPTRAAWRVGQRLSESLIAKYHGEEGNLPENVAFYWMAGDIMSSDGEMFAEMFAMLGVEPVWSPNGQVKTFTIIPLVTLGRPRIDITVRTSGILRDNFSNCYELLDEAVMAVAALDEPVEQNYVRKHTLAAIGQEGMSIRDATLRIFSSQPGTYSSGVNLAVLASAWKDEKDLADIFVAVNGYAYGKEITGRNAHEQLASSLSTVSVTFNKVQSDEYDLLGCCCYFGAHGGMTAAARHYSGNEVKPYYGDTREPGHIEVRDLADEIRRVVRTKLLNPKWIDGMKEHGYKGASDIMKRVTRVYGWEASTQEVDDWIFDDIAQTFVNNEEMREFFEKNNPYALEEISRRLLEAEQRGLWNADEDVLNDLKNNYLEIESWMEDLVGEGEYQGGSVDIITKDDVAAWGDSMNEIMAKIHTKHRH
ncbi:cobaltochelatase subunit CobN [Methanoregula sp.]|uniref:cobaltochelatase subunit CobN n=1 Tax=Methanoregula sp. TaxID=2052170 RepID=UPI00237238C0|nr:cobaltochelatase subunit CobN [Methanoregula sp.]MDD1685795.1 cobaltochelatase subunit CobN [Methanoregula sp.]